MNLQQLRYLVEIADCRSITGASKKLFVSQPYLSKVVSDFEARTGKQIFVRLNTGLELTAYGQRVYLLARSIIRQMERLEHLEKEERPERDSVKLSFSVGNLIVKDRLLSDYFSGSRAFRCEIDCYETTIGGCLKNVQDGVSEFAIAAADDFQKEFLTSISARRGLECIELDESCPYCHFHRNHSLADLDEIRPDSLMPYPFVRMKEDEFPASGGGIQKKEDPENYASRCMAANTYRSCLNLVRHSSAFMIGSRWQVSELERLGIQSVRFPFLSYRIHLMILKKEAAPFSPEAERYLQLFRESCGLEGA